MTLNRALLLLPLALLLGLAALLVANSGKRQTDAAKSRMVGKPVPEFSLGGLDEAHGLAHADLATGEPVLVNVFASWCLPCQVEAPHLNALAQAGATVNGIAVRDAPEETRAFLARHGNPYRRIGIDRGGQMMLALGSSGVPETFVIDGKGVVRYQHRGDVRAADVQTLLAELERAR